LLAQLLTRFVAFPPCGFQVEAEVFEIELELVDRVLRDADEAFLQAEDLTESIAQGPKLGPKPYWQVLDAVQQINYLLR
jgi:hypothetical protein